MGTHVVCSMHAQTTTPLKNDAGSRLFVGTSRADDADAAFLVCNIPLYMSGRV